MEYVDEKAKFERKSHKGDITMDDTTKGKLSVNIREINKNLMRIAEEKLSTKELVKMEFDAIRALIDDCEKLAVK